MEVLTKDPQPPMFQRAVVRRITIDAKRAISISGNRLDKSKHLRPQSGLGPPLCGRPLNHAGDQTSLSPSHLRCSHSASAPMGAENPIRNQRVVQSTASTEFKQSTNHEDETLQVEAVCLTGVAAVQMGAVSRTDSG